MHEHSWYFTFAPARWTASCGCGLALVVEEREAGGQSWTWTLHGGMPPASMMVAAVGSVTRARRALLAAPGPAGN
jgi:hypothetical protein